jgi:NhaA family Na+:H+ antiporter
VFAFFAAGVALVDTEGPAALAGPVTIGIVAGLLGGKPLGVLAGAWLVQRITRTRLGADLAWSDVLGSRCCPGSGSPCRCSSAS